MGFVRLAAGLAVGWVFTGLAARLLHTWAPWAVAEIAIAAFGLLLAREVRFREMGIGLTVGWATLTAALFLFAAG